MSSCVITPDPCVLRVFRGVERWRSARSDRAKEVDLNCEGTPASHQRVLEGSSLKWAPDRHFVPGFFPNLSLQGGQQIFSLLDVPAGNVPRSWKRSQRPGSAQQEHTASTKDRGADAYFCVGVPGHREPDGWRMVSPLVGQSSAPLPGSAIWLVDLSFSSDSFRAGCARSH
jgi:hypothetical protein